MGASGMGDDRDTPNDSGTGPAPGLDDALRDIGDTGKATLKASVDAAKAFRTLVLADISLARSAFGRALAFTGVAIVFGASAWLLLMATLIVFLSNGLGWPWAWSLLLTAGLSLLVTGFGAWSAIRYFEHTRLQATRRQLARLGIGELADFTPTPGSPQSTRQATEVAPPETPAGDPVKDQRGVDITPP
ncbi:phage holin family protein [Lysobacter olei]